MVLFLSTLLLEKGFYMLKISDAINVQVLQLPNDKNGRTAIVSANIIMTDGRVISDVCSISPRSPFENEDTLELAKNKIINSIKQKAEPYIKNHQNSSQDGSQDDKSRFKGGGVNCPSFAIWLRRRGEIQKSLLLHVLANSYKTSRDGRQIA